MNRASIIVDFRHIRCGNCKVALRDELATACRACGAEFDNIMSNHVGLAARFECQREASGVCRAHAQVREVDVDPTELVGA
jgi:hypothetical protein